MKTVGIIGGLGPKTTAEFYLELIFLCQKINKINRPSILISSIPLPYCIEEEAIVKGKGEERFIPFLLDSARNLEKVGADFIVMPCNSLHAFIEEIRSAVKIPVLSIIEETAKFLKKENISEVGILSTSITLDRKLYENFLMANGIKQVTPNNSQQARIGKMIYRIVTNKHGDKDRKELAGIIDDFKKRGIKHIIFACTDLQLLISSHSHLKIYDTMKIFAEATVREIRRD